MQEAILGGTAFPIILKHCPIMPLNSKSFGNDCNRAASFTVIERACSMSGWINNRPSLFRCETMVGEGLSHSRFLYFPCWNSFPIVCCKTKFSPRLAYDSCPSQSTPENIYVTGIVVSRFMNLWRENQPVCGTY